MLEMSRKAPTPKSSVAMVGWDCAADFREAMPMATWERRNADPLSAPASPGLRLRQAL